MMAIGKAVEHPKLPATVSLRASNLFDPTKMKRNTDFVWKTTDE